MLSRSADDRAAAALLPRRSGAGGDRAAAQDGVTVVEDRRLAPRDTAGGRPQPDLEQITVEARGSRVDLAMRAFHGRAYVPALVPGNLAATVVQ